jgi:hypothetical protein
MHFAIALVLCSQFAAADHALSAGSQLVYRGSLVPVKDDSIPARKEFELTIVVSDAAIADNKAPAAGSQTLLWTIEESGRGSWLWLDHFGAWCATTAKAGRPCSTSAPTARAWCHCRRRSLPATGQLAAMRAGPKDGWSIA